MNANVDLKLEDLKTTFNTNIGEINTGLTEDLATMKTTFDTSMSAIDGKTVEELEELNRQFDTQITALNAQLDTNLGKTESIFATTGDQINTQATTVLNTLKTIYGSGAEAVSNLAQGILEKLPDAEDAAKTLVEKVLDQLTAMIDHFRTIGMESAAAYVSGLGEYGEFNPTNATTSNFANDVFAGLSKDLVKANSVSAANVSFGSTPSKDTSSQNGSKKIAEIRYTQNNYSPKPLSRLEIYRDTKTQLATLKEAVSTI